MAWLTQKQAEQFLCLIDAGSFQLVSLVYILNQSAAGSEVCTACKV